MSDQQLNSYRFQLTGEEKFRIKVFKAVTVEQAYALADEYISRNHAYDDWEYIPEITTYPTT